MRDHRGVLASHKDPEVDVFYASGPGYAATITFEVHLTSGSGERGAVEASAREITHQLKQAVIQQQRMSSPKLY